ncbi:hypothetical protein [Bradyrhizobium sp. 141]|uniref:hypothetical protein n=1 Tax=Bradyrhizobium sp. 141 TaxID=2782617 RepID=UPI001FFC0A93|nr:hypothetical protein [Bradyrhizobium sp. 141]MCK1718865.1 hypothetical protein [Bradyrhizobium sp. 141]
MAQKILGAQRDFSFGEVDVALKRLDEHPARKAGLRQMSNMRILNSGPVQNRPGRSALFVAENTERIEEVAMSPGNVFKIAFGASVAFGEIRIFDSAGAQVAYFATQGSGTLLPWNASNLDQIVFAQLNLSIYITFGHAMRPQVLTWDGVSAWSIADYTELVSGGQKKTPFYRISPQNIAIGISAQTGTVTVTAVSPLFTPAWVGTRMRFVERQILITGYTDALHVTGTVQEPLPGSQILSFSVDPSATFGIGDVVIGSQTGAKGIVVTRDAVAKNIGIQLLSTTTTTQTTFSFEGLSTSIFAFVLSETVVGPGGSLVNSGVSAVGTPSPVTIWDEEVMNDHQGYPASVFVDQFRLGFCDFPSVPGGISWSAINSPTDLYVGANPSNAIFEVTPDKVQVYYVVPGPESSEFVFCDSKLYYIKIDANTPLTPGSVGFQVLSSDGCAQVQPRASQELILYANAGRSSMMAIVASGAYYRPFNTKNLSELHSHLFQDIRAIAVPTADGTFDERYAYVLNEDGSLVVGKYNLGDIVSGNTKVGWGPWSGEGSLKWVCALGADVIFTTAYSGVTLCELLDDSQYLDAALYVNNLPAAMAAPVGKGPLWWIPGSTVTLMDQGTRPMGTYNIDADGFIIPQNQGGEDLTAETLVAGQPWTSVLEPFAPDAAPGADVGQRMKRRKIARFAIYVIHSTGFVMARLFSGRITTTSPDLGDVVNQRTVPAYNIDDDATKPPPSRETVERWRPSGRTFDPRVAVIKDSPGPLLVAEIAVEVTI